MRCAVGAEYEGHVSDAFAMWHSLGVQRDVYAGLVVVMLNFLFFIFEKREKEREALTHIDDAPLRVA